MNNLCLKHFSTIVMLLSASISLAQVTGVVVNRERKPIADASVTLVCDGAEVLGRSATNRKGAFSLEVKKASGKDCILRFSHSAYATRVLSLQNMPVKMALDTIRLDDNILDEVTVDAERFVDKVDGKLLFPSKEVVKRSVSGYDLLENIELPGIYVDMVNKKVEKRGAGSVPIFINEKRASQVDIVALRPDEVIRIEYIDNPGVEYGLETPSAVIKFVVKPRIKGMSVGVDLSDALTTLHGRNYLYGQCNYRLSRWTIYYQNDFSRMSRRHIDQTDVYTLADGNLHEIDREGINTKLAYASHETGLTYDLTKQGKYALVAQMSASFYDSPNRKHRQRISETGKPDYYALTEPTEHFFSPTLDLFFRRYFKKNRTLTLNLVGTMYDTSYGYSYRTFAQDDFAEPTSQYGYETDGKRYSVIGDVKYSQPLGNANWTTGINYLQGYTRNKYTGTSDIVNDMRNSSAYLYTQVSGRLKKLRYMVGIGGSYRYYTQGSESYHYFLLRPSFSLSHPVLSKGNVRYTFSLSPNAPSLSIQSDNRQQSNEYEYHVGNPHLEPYHRITQTLVLSYQHKYFYVENTIGHIYCRKPIMEEITRGHDASGKTWFDFGYAQQKRASDLWNYTNLQLYVIPNVLTLNGGFSYLTTSQVGNSYDHNFHRLWGYVGGKLFLGKWNIGASWSAKERSFSGESESLRGQNMDIRVSYKINSNLSVGLYGSHLFLKDGATFGKATTSRYVKKNETVYIPEWGNMISLSLSWNLSRGRQYQSDNKNVWNRDNDTGIFKK